jgi:hypothetical protein
MVEEEKQEPSIVDKAYAAAERLEKANKQQEELLKRMEAIESRKILGGQSAAGVTAVPPKEETPAEYAKRMVRGGQ